MAYLNLKKLNTLFGNDKVVIIYMVFVPSYYVLPLSLASNIVVEFHFHLYASANLYLKRDFAFTFKALS